MKSRLSISFIIILILGIVVAFLTYDFLSSSKTVIYIFNKDYQAGTQVTEDILIPMETDTDIVEIGRQTGFVYVTQDNIEEVLGSYLITNVAKGTPLSAAVTDRFGGSPPEIYLAPNHVAVTVPCDNITGVNPYIKYGARVNIYAGVETEEGDFYEYLLLQNIKVLDVQYSTMAGDTNSPVLSGITLELTPEQSVAVQYACEFGKVRLGLVKPGQYKEATTSPYSIKSVVASSSSGEGEQGTKNDAENDEK